MTLDGVLDITVTDDVVQFAFTVTNVSAEPIDLTFRSGEKADVAVFEDDVEVWRWSDGRMFTQAIETETLQPDDTLVHEATWEDPPAGDYVAEASLAATEVTVAEQKSFEVL